MTFSTWLLVQCVIMALLGQTLHLLLVKIPSFKKKSQAANKNFSFKEMWLCDWNVIVATAIIIALVTIGLDQLIAWKPQIKDYVKWYYAGLGAFGSTIAMSRFSQFEAGLTNLLSVKSNVSDAVTGGSTTVAETVRKAENVGIENADVNVNQK